MRIALSKSKSIDLDFKKFFRSLGTGWMKIYHYVFLCSFVLILVWGAWVGYENLVNFEWPQDRKDAYINAERRKFAFPQERFNGVVADIEERSRAYGQQLQDIKNPFYEPVIPDAAQVAEESEKVSNAQATEESVVSESGGDIE